MERQANPHALGQREGDDAGTLGGRAAARVELVLVNATRRDAEHVPVEGPVGRARHAGHQVDLVVAETVQATRNDQLELRARVVVHSGREPQQLLACCRA